MARKHDIRRGDGFVEERTTKAGAVRYVARWHDGDRWRGKTFPTVEEAEDHLRSIGRAKRRGDYSPDSPMTVAELLAVYIERGARRWSANTVATYTLIAERYIGPHIGKKRVVTVTPPQVQAWLDRLTREGLSAAIVGNARSLLSGACDEALRMGMVRANPVAGTRAPARPRGERVTWSADDVARVLDAVDAEPHAVQWRAFYLLALTTGMRPGELRAVRWRDIDLDTGTVTIRRTMTRNADFRHDIGDVTKTGRVRTVAVPLETTEALRLQRADQRRRRIAAEHWRDRDLAFDRGDGNPVAQQSASNVHHRVCTRAGVPRIRMHDLRHTAATLMLANGTHPLVVSQMLGHASITTTLDIYSHVDVSMQRAASDALADTILRKKRRV